MRVDEPELAWRTFSTLARLGAVVYLQEFVPHEEGDFRVLLVGRRAWAIRRTNPADWRNNLSRGAKAERCELDPVLADTARRAAEAVGCSLAGVDLLRTPTGWSVIEVNGSPGWRGVNAAHGVDVAAAVIEHLEAIVNRRRPR